MPKQPELVPPPQKSKGRKQNVSAKAWITRESSKDHFTSKVSLGKGRIYERSTQTKRRNVALEFNRAHLLELLSPKTKAPATPPPTQLDLTEWVPPQEPHAS
jgi:hypothetical protein